LPVVNSVARTAPPWSAASTTHSDWTLHQLSPYIGRMKTAMAKALIDEYTDEQGLVVDPFSGSGVVPLEAAACGRNVVARDWNPYAFLLTKAKLFPPNSLDIALEDFERTWARSRKLLQQQDLQNVPEWVKVFFHPNTLRSTLAFRDACVSQNNYFLLACLLGILHHQRPGFLSFPSSHLVPYLRDRKFPRGEYADLYQERDVHSRMEAKIKRAFRRVPDLRGVSRVVAQGDARTITSCGEIQAVITSPPYMNELDYVRDNRLRLWLIKRELPSGLEIPARARQDEFVGLMRTVSRRLAPNLRRGGCFVFVVGEVTRKRVAKEDSAVLLQRLFAGDCHLTDFRLIRIYDDVIPDIRRSRRECSGTKAETVLVFRKEK
jgi:hypothetical protein